MNATMEDLRNTVILAGAQFSLYREAILHALTVEDPGYQADLKSSRNKLTYFNHLRRNLLASRESYDSFPEDVQLVKLELEEKLGEQKTALDRCTTESGSSRRRSILEDAYDTTVEQLEVLGEVEFVFSRHQELGQAVSPFAVAQEVQQILLSDR